MKKIGLLAIPLALSLAVSVPAWAANPTGGDVTIRTTVEESYTITIPSNTEIAFGVESTKIGDLGLATAQLGPKRQVTFTADVSVAGAGKLTHSDNSTTLPYTLNIDGAATNKAGFTAVGVKPVTVNITKAAWDAAPAGSYSDTITFSVTCVNIP